MERAAAVRASILILESLDDKRLWQRFVERGSCRILMAGGKTAAIKSLELLRGSSDEHGVLALLDSDFDALLGQLLTMDNLIYLDAHDAETFLLRSLAFESVLGDLVEDAQLRRGELAYGSPLKVRICKEARRLGNVRLRAQRDGWQVSFVKFKCVAHSDPATGFLLDDRVVQFANAQAAVGAEAVLGALSEETAMDDWHLCHGKDLLALTCGVLQVSYGVRRLDADGLFRMLRLAFSESDLEVTQTYAQVRAWERRTGNRVLM